MSVQTFLQIIGACFGVIGSLFFAFGVMWQPVDVMVKLSKTYWDFNPQMVRALASQKADYLFGGVFIFLAFCLSLLSFLFTQSNMPISLEAASRVPWIAVVLTVVLFLLLLLFARLVAHRFEGLIEQRLREKNEETKRKMTGS